MPRGTRSTQFFQIAGPSTGRGPLSVICGDGLPVPSGLPQLWATPRSGDAPECESRGDTRHPSGCLGDDERPRRALRRVCLFAPQGRMTGPLVLAPASVRTFTREPGNGPLVDLSGAWYRARGPRPVQTSASPAGDSSRDRSLCRWHRGRERKNPRLADRRFFVITRPFGWAK
jgi:hypothetical protein